MRLSAIAKELRRLGGIAAAAETGEQLNVRLKDGTGLGASPLAHHAARPSGGRTQRGERCILPGRDRDRAAKQLVDLLAVWVFELCKYLGLRAHDLRQHKMRSVVLGAARGTIEQPHRTIVLPGARKGLAEEGQEVG